MNNDCAFINENYRFRYRTGGIIIKDDKMLFAKCSKKNYYYMIGGAVNLGETSLNCIEREIFEETGLKTEVEKLSVICENFFKEKNSEIDECIHHIIEFYYSMKIIDFNSLKMISDNGNELIWISIKDIQNSNIKPNFIRNRIKEIINSNCIIHVIEESDR